MGTNMVGSHSTTKKARVDTQGGTGIKNLEHRYTFYFIFKESFVIEQQIQFRVGFLSVASELRVQCPMVELEVKVWDTFRKYISFYGILHI